MIPLGIACSLSDMPRWRTASRSSKVHDDGQLHAPMLSSFGKWREAITLHHAS